MATTLGSTGVTFPDTTTQTTAVPAPSTSGNVLTSNGSAWTSAAPPVSSGALIGYTVFATAGTFAYTKATNNPSFIIVEVVGGGAGSSASSSSGSPNGGAAGGTSSFGAFCSATGGGATATTTASAGGTGTGGDLNVSGMKGVYRSGTSALVSEGGCSFLGSCGSGGGASEVMSITAVSINTGGGGGYARKKILASALAASETVTVGAGGTTTTQTAGFKGIVIVWEYR